MRRSYATVVGGRPLKGTVSVDPNRHCLTLVIALAVASGAEIEIADVGHSPEIGTLMAICSSMGMTVRRGEGGSCVLEGSPTTSVIPARLSRDVHGATYLIPAILARTGHVEFSDLGGDQLGEFEFGLGRPIGHLLNIMERFGARWERKSGDGVFCVTMVEPRSAALDIQEFSDEAERFGGSRVSSATKCAIVMAVGLHVRVSISHPHFKECEYDGLKMISSLGFAVRANADSITIGPPAVPISRAGVDVVCDPAELMTWVVLSGLCGDGVVIRGRGMCGALRFAVPEFESLDPGWRSWLDGESLRMGRQTFKLLPELRSTSNGINTDCLPLLAVAAAFMRSSATVVRDEVWGDRFGYAEGLAEFGIWCERTVGGLIVHPMRSSQRSRARFVGAGDTRAVAVLLIAALATPGQTMVGGYEHVERGYGDFAGKLSELGGVISVRRTND